MSTEPPFTTPIDDPRSSRGGAPSRVSNSQRWFGLLLAAVLVGGALLVARPGNGDDGDEAAFGVVAQVRPDDAAVGDLPTAPATGKLAPNFLLQDLDGRSVRLSDLRGRPVFLNFWATWCFFCVGEMPAMQRLADEYGARVVVLGVNVGESAADARTFAQNNGIRYPLLLDPDRAVTAAYQPRAMPTSLFIDAAGVVRAVSYGVLTPPQMREHLAPLLPE